MNTLLIVLYKLFCKLYFLIPILSGKKDEIVLDKEYNNRA